jgi:hypothetical protein
LEKTFVKLFPFGVFFKMIWITFSILKRHIFHACDLVSLSSTSSQGQTQKAGVPVHTFYIFYPSLFNLHQPYNQCNFQVNFEASKNRAACQKSARVISTI